MIKDAVVLVVDDERDHADGMAEALQKCCAKAIPVYTGRDALEIILMLGLGLPELPGRRDFRNDLAGPKP